MASLVASTVLALSLFSCDEECQGISPTRGVVSSTKAGMADVNGFRPRCCNAIFGPGGNSHCSSSALRVVVASQAKSARIALQQKFEILSLSAGQSAEI